MDFTQIFKHITPEEIPGDVFTLAGKVFPVITAGRPDHYNAMTGSGGGMGVLMRKPAVWCILQSTRYTLELMLQQQAYTLCYFGDEYKKQVLFLGSKSGRDSDKMKEVSLTPVETPAGNMAFEEARLVIECKLSQITTPNPDDFCSQELRDYVNEMYKDPREQRKYVFGEITHVWVKK